MNPSRESQSLPFTVAWNKFVGENESDFQTLIDELKKGKRLDIQMLRNRCSIVKKQIENYLNVDLPTGGTVRNLDPNSSDSEDIYPEPYKTCVSCLDFFLKNGLLWRICG